MSLWVLDQVLKKFWHFFVNDRPETLLDVVLVEELMEGASVISPLWCIVGDNKVPGMSRPIMAVDIKRMQPSTFSDGGRTYRVLMGEEIRSE
jgi:hypothetical protein